MERALPKIEIANPHLPIALLAAALVALGALWLTLGLWFLPLLVALALVASVLTPTRFDTNSRVIVALRIALYTWVLFWAWNHLNSEDGDSLEVTFAYGGALGAACELALQAWLKKPFGGARGAVSVLLSAGIMMGACITFEPSYVRFLAPLYMLCLAFSLRSFRGTGAVRRNKKRTGLAWAAILLAVTAGAGTHATVMVYRYEIGQLGAKLFNENVKAEPVGLSTTPQLGPSYGENASTTRVLRLENWPMTQQYLRVMSFSTYGHGAWTPRLDARTYRDVSNQELQTGGAGHKARIDRLIDDEGLVVAPLDSVSITAPEGASLEWTPQAGGPLRSKDPAPFPFVYEVTLPSQPNHQGPLCVPPSDQEMQRCLQIPAEIPLEVRLLAHQIAGGIDDPMGRVKAIESYLMTSNEYSSTSRPGKGDPAAAFILEKKAAHCEYFASAAAMLLRCVDVPTRYVIGYYVSEKEGDGAVVRFRDGHAWCESWIPGTGWVTVDATPGTARPDKFNPPISFWQKLRERTQDLIMLVRNTIARGGPAGKALLAGAALLLLVGLALRRLWLDRRQREPVFQYAAAPDLHSVKRRFEKLLRRRGLSCPEGRTWREHLDTVAADAAVAAKLDIPSAFNFVRLYNRARFAQQDAADISRLHELLRHLEKTDKQKS